MYDQEIMSRLGHGLQIRQPKLEAIAATGPIYGVAQYSQVGRRAASNTLQEEEVRISVTDYRGSHYLVTHHLISRHRMRHHLFLLPISITYHRLSGAVYSGYCGSSSSSSCPLHCVYIETLELNSQSSRSFNTHTAKLTIRLRTII